MSDFDQLLASMTVEQRSQPVTFDQFAHALQSTLSANKALKRRVAELEARIAKVESEHRHDA